ncbi:MAG: hypothetical protein MJ224_05720, partial [archaeon]|nr:hypothetical protein [archaeon]
MKLRYKTLMFLTLLIFCIGSVCAADPDNNTNINADNNIVKVSDVEKFVMDQHNEIQILKEDNKKLNEDNKILKED